MCRIPDHPLTLTPTPTITLTLLLAFMKNGPNSRNTVRRLGPMSGKIDRCANNSRKLRAGTMPARYSDDAARMFPPSVPRPSLSASHSDSDSLKDIAQRTSTFSESLFQPRAASAWRRACASPATNWGTSELSLWVGGAGGGYAKLVQLGAASAELVATSAKRGAVPPCRSDQVLPQPVPALMF